MYFICMTAAILLEPLCHTWVTSSLSTASTKGKKQFHNKLNETEIDRNTNPCDFAFLLFKRSLSEQRFKKWLFSLISLISLSLIILAKRVIFLNILLMCLHESEWVWMSLSECQRMVRIEKFCYMIEIGDTAMNIVRNCIPMRNCMLRERLWSESHFRLVYL